MQSTPEAERSAIRRRAIEHIELALQLCDETETWGPACHLQLGLDLLTAMERGSASVLPVTNRDSHGIDSADRRTHDMIRPD